MLIIMKKNLICSIILLLVAGTFSLKAQSQGNSTTDVILNGYSAKMFTSEPVKDTDLDLILKCGIKAPSARNTQGWKFTVIKNAGLAGEIIKNINPGNIIVIVSGIDSQQPGTFTEFDCALATQNMYIAGQSLGYGVHIYAGPVGMINQKKEAYGIPEGYRAISVLRIGSIDKNVDATSSASARKPFGDIVIYK
jgi:nitroreductase